MASGGMDWAYRMVAQGDLDPLGALIVMHLGWRDAPSQRTDRGIARALALHRTSVQKATARLAELGVIVRRSGQWVAVETVRIVEESPDARRPDAASADGGANSVGRTTEAAGGGQLSWPQTANSVGHKRKEKIREGAHGPKSPEKPAHRSPPKGGGAQARQTVERTGAQRRQPMRGQGRTEGAEPSGPAADVAQLGQFQRSLLRRGASFVVETNGHRVLVSQGSPELVAMQAELRRIEGGAA